MTVVAKGAVFTKLNKPLEIWDLVWDEPREDEVAVRVTACGVCQSDFHAVNGQYPTAAPAVLGHEGGGIVEKVGKKVTRVKPGDKIVMSWMPSCGHCPSCVSGAGHLCDRGAKLNSGARDDGSFRVHDKKGGDVIQYAFLGAFSEYVVIPEDGCIPVDKSIDLRQIPIVGCRIPTGFGAAVNVAKVKYGSTVLIVGLGGIGVNCLQGCKNNGASIIIVADIHDKKKWAMEFGATHYIDASKQNVLEEVMKITGCGVDYAFDCIGDNKVQQYTVEALCKGGEAVWVGVVWDKLAPININGCSFTLFNKHIHGTCYGGESPFEMVPRLLKMYQSGRIKMGEMITKEYKLEQINEAFADMFAGKNICGSIRF
jgi:NDMA-dependent alcohol dehydrogenase